MLEIVKITSLAPSRKKFGSYWYIYFYTAKIVQILFYCFQFILLWPNNDKKKFLNCYCYVNNMYTHSNTILY